ncbi:hypothetical protein ACOI1H_20660, partial [Loktanella sp. DJP18]|uniref:hypothetical protein n=1 Tax=Loktanella sp. DJP18 TaxID=3409788 RepID=UPI003BB6AC2D
MSDHADRPAYTYDDAPSRLLVLLAAILAVTAGLIVGALALVSPDGTLSPEMLIAATISTYVAAWLATAALTKWIGCNTTYLVYRPL